MDLGRVTTSGRPVSASGGTVPESKGAAPGADNIGSLVGATKADSPCGKARILTLKSTDLH